MTDEELVERLRSYAKDQGGWHNIDDTCEEAADRIEALTTARDEAYRLFAFWRAEADRLTEQLAAARQDAKERDAAEHLARMRKAFIEEARDERDDLQAKLAKAVEALTDIVKDCEAEYPPSHVAIKYFCLATLAEIEGEKG